MKRREPDELLKDVFTDESLEALRAASLGSGLAAMRTRRRYRALRAGALAAVPVLALALVFLRQKPVENMPASIASLPAPHARIKFYPATKATDVPPVKTISDEDLLALFADRPVGLIGQSGRQELMFFDQPAAGASL